MKDIIIRREMEEDYLQVYELIRQAFQNEPHSNQQEHQLVERLRKSDAFVPELSLVAEQNGKLVGHILLTKIKIKDYEKEHESLALAPVSVVPANQKQGIGGQLIIKAHAQARQLGFSSVILLGHAGYYPRFGYQKASNFGISLPFDVPEENCMAIELKTKGLAGIKGVVEYPQAFFD